jgi:hypothetical protein
MDERRLFDLLLDNVTRFEAEGYAGSYIKSILKAVKSWLRHNHLTLASGITIANEDATPTLQDERVPTPDELGTILHGCSLGEKVAVSLSAFSGLRPEVLGNYRGTDGLMVGDLPELTVDAEAGNVVFQSLPTFIVVRDSLSKAGHRYLTLLGEEGCLYLKEYLETRMREGEKLTSKSAIVKPTYAAKPFIRTSNIGDKIRNAIRSAGFSWRPYVLRCYFDTRLLLAESNRSIIRDYRVFWMGHKGDIEQLYTLNKQVLPPDLMENMREGYRKSQPLLETAGLAERQKEDIRLAFKRELLLIAGYKQEEVDALQVAEMEDDEIHRRCRERLLGALLNNGSKQRVITIREVEKYVRQGWEYVDRLPSGKAIVRLPSA